MKTKNDAPNKRKMNFEPSTNNKKSKHDKSPELLLETSLDSSASSDSDTEEELDVPDGYLEKTPYKLYLNENQRGKISSIKETPEGIIHCENLYFSPNNTINYVANIPVIASKDKKSVTLQQMLQTQSFGKTEQESEQQAQNRMALAVGVNKQKSVIQDNNKILYEELKSPVTSKFPYKRIGYFWKPQWEMIKSEGYDLNISILEKLPKKEVTSLIKVPTLIKLSDGIYIYGKWLGQKKTFTLLEDNVFIEFFKQKRLPEQITVSNRSYPELFNAIIKEKGHSGKTQPVGLGTVRKWSKSSDTNKERKYQHINEEEKKPKLKMIPYREIRDTLKDSHASMRLLQSFQNRAPTYLMFFDSSIETFRTIEGIGVMSSYDKIIQKYYKNNNNNLPIVVSTGYRIDSKKYSLHAKSIDYDMVVRTQTDKKNENSIYPPEPNFGILTLHNKKVESFGDGKKNYESPNEAPNMVNNIIKDRQIKPNEVRTLFKGKHAVQIEARPRMLKNSFKGCEKEFNSSKVNFRGEIINWNEQFFKSLRNMSQSHLKHKQWAESTLRKYELMPVTIYVTHNGGLSMTQDALSKENKLPDYKLNINQVKCMLVSLLTKLFTAYDPISISNKLADDFRANLLKVLKTYNKIVPYIPMKEDRQAAKHALYTYFDKAKTLDQIKGYIGLLSASVGESFDKINQAAQSTGQKIYGNLCRDCFSDHPQRVEDLLIELIHDNAPLKKPSKAFLTTMRGMIKEICEDNFISCGEGHFEMSYLHLAALAGNKEYVQNLLEKNKIDKNLKAMHGILPLHCAITYHIQHEVDYDFEYKYETDLALIELLADKENLYSKMANGKTALYLILTKLPNPDILVERLYKKNHISEFHYRLLMLYIITLKLNDIPYEEYNNPIIHIIEYIEDEYLAARLVLLFTILGVDIDENLRENDDYPPLYWAIEKERPLIVQAIRVGDGCFSDIYDKKGLPPLLFALHHHASDVMLKTLYDCGAKLLETNLDQESMTDEYPFYPILQTCAIIEIVRPRLGGERNLALLQYIIDNETIQSIKSLLFTTHYDEDRSDDEDDEDGSQNLVDILIEEEDIEALEIVFFNNDRKPNARFYMLCDEIQNDIKDLMPGMLYKSGPSLPK